MKLKFTFSSVFIFVFSVAYGQFGSRNTYEFLSLPISSRITALGGVGTFIKDDDINLAFINPSLINEKMDGSIGFNHNFYFADITNGHFAIGKKIKGFNTHLAFTYLNYGESNLTNEFEEVLGKFSGSDRAITLGIGKQLNERISAGINVKGIISSLESYSSTGLAFDAALSYAKEDKNVVYSLLIKNLGTELSSFNGKKLPAPLDIQLGFSKKLQHLPLRFSIIAHQLQQWNVRYDDPDDVQINLLGETSEKSNFSKSIDNLFRHLMFNAELSMGKTGGFQLRAGYNHFRRAELNLSTIRGMAGFSAGFGIKIKQFNLDYGLGYYHLAGAANHLSLRTNLDRFKKKIPI